jgi:chromosome partitioning protein
MKELTMIRVIFNQKGGVGKSSIAVNLAALSAEYGFRTLLIDLDSQANSSQYLLGGDIGSGERSITDYFVQSLAFKLITDPAADFVCKTPYPNLDPVVANSELAEIQQKLETRHKIFKLRDFLTSLADDYDMVYIDTPPAFNFYTLSALIAADRCIIPFDCDDFSRRALYTLVENVAETRSDHNPRLRVEGIVVNQFRSNANFPKKIVNELREEALPVLNTMLSSSVRMRESHNAAVPLIKFAPSHKLTQEFITLFEEINSEFLEPVSAEAEEA